MDQLTPMTEQQHQMLSYWQGMKPDADTAFLVDNLIRKFSMNKNTAWVLAVRFKNERRG